MSTTLAISHYLHLTKDQRYRWQQGEELEVVGVSSPVWFFKGISSEPAIEVFCKYKLHSDGPGIFIKNVDNGYDVTVPCRPETEALPLPDEIWNSLTQEQQEEWYEQNQPSQSLVNLLDIKDGGAAYLAFRQFSKVRKNKKVLNVIHYMEVKDIQILLDTLT